MITMKQENQNKYDVIMIGGGASGFFTAINLAEEYPDLRIAILERSGKVLSKVKISGGGRCNVAHAEYSPSEMVKNYPRGEKKLRGPFHRFMTADVVRWFEDRGVLIKTEKDGRMFPVSDDSQTVIDCFMDECKRDRKSTRLNSSHVAISYAVFCLKKNKIVIHMRS